MTQPVTFVICSHSRLRPRRHPSREPLEPRPIETLKDCRAEPMLLRRWQRDSSGQPYRGAPEFCSEIIRMRGPRPNDTGLPERSVVKRDWETGVRWWALRCAPCKLNPECRSATLGVVLNALYRVVPAGDNEERTVELHTLQVMLSKVHLLG